MGLQPRAVILTAEAALMVRYIHRSAVYTIEDYFELTYRLTTRHCRHLPRCKSERRTKLQTFLAMPSRVFQGNAIDSG
jgi:hypothetical protein